MVYKCCVPNCRGNYDEGNKVHIFKFPDDPHLKSRWLHGIKRANFTPTKNSVVCEKHFNEGEIRSFTEFNSEDGQLIKVPLKIPRLIPGAVPSILPNCPSYLSTSKKCRECPEEKRRRIENQNIQTAIHESEVEFNAHKEMISFVNFEELNGKLKFLKMCDLWNIINCDKHVIIIKVELSAAPQITSSIVIEKSLDVTVYYKNIKLDAIGNFLFPKYVNNLGEIEKMIEKLETLTCPEKQSQDVSEMVILISSLIKHISALNSKLCGPLEFFSEQLSLWTQQKRHYTPSLMILSSMLHSISPHCYAYLRHMKFVHLPHPCTIRRLCSSFTLDPRPEEDDEHFLKYVTEKFSGEHNDKYIVLMMDELYVKPFMDYKGGNIVGKARNNELLATSAYCFMISSLLSNFQDVAHIVPVRTINGEYLYFVLKKVILGLEKAGFHVVCVVSDNSAVNRKCMQFFSPNNELKSVYPHPADEKRSLFFVFDSVHILKCVRNNWLHQKDENMSMTFPNFESNDSILQNASFTAIRRLYDLEHDKLVKYGYGLSLKALNPSSFEKQNVKLALQVFNDNVENALKVLGAKHDLPHSEETASFIRIILNWWSIVNVKTPGKGARLNNTFMYPVSSDSDDSVMYLKRFLLWLVKWRSLKVKNKLSSETMSAVTITTEGLLKIIDYCLCDLKFSYVLLGKFQTDVLEDRFGRYRQLAGGQYNISMRQLFEVEKKLRVQSSMCLRVKSGKFGEIRVGIKEFFEPSLVMTSLKNIENSFAANISVNSEDIAKCDDEIPILVYLAGYCCYSVARLLRCNFCKEILVTGDFFDPDDEASSLIVNKSRGGLLVPEMFVVDVIVHNYIIMSKFCSDWEADFLTVDNQREFLCGITMKVVKSKGLLWEPNKCHNGHAAEYVCSKLIWTSSNILLNNYCKKKIVDVKPAFTRKRKVFCNK